MPAKLFLIFVTLLVSACDEQNGSEQPATTIPNASELSGASSPPTTITNTVELKSSTEVQEVNSLVGIQGQTSAGLKGIDDNANAIRDDIDQLIEQKFSYSAEVKRAAEQEARALQQFMEATTKEAALKAAEQMARATRCTFKVLSDPIRDYEKRQALSKELEAWTVNTEERFSKYLKSSQFISGTYFMQPVEPVCD